MGEAPVIVLTAVEQPAGPARSFLISAGADGGLAGPGQGGGAEAVDLGAQCGWARGALAWVIGSLASA